MPIYATVYWYVDDSDLISKHRPQHRDYISSLTGKGLVASGKTEESDGPSALLLFDCESKPVVERLLDSDPFQTLGLIRKREIFEWVISTGSLGRNNVG